MFTALYSQRSLMVYISLLACCPQRHLTHSAYQSQKLPALKVYQPSWSLLRYGTKFLACAADWTSAELPRQMVIFSSAVTHSEHSLLSDARRGAKYAWLLSLLEARFVNI